MEISKKRWLKISTHPNFSVILVVRAVPLIREKYLYVTCVKSFLLQATIIPGFARQKRIVLYVENSFLRSSYYLQLNQVSDVHTKLIFVLVAQRSYRHIGVSKVFLLYFWWNNLQEFNIGAKKQLLRADPFRKVAVNICNCSLSQQKMLQTKLDIIACHTPRFAGLICSFY